MTDIGQQDVLNGKQFQALKTQQKNSLEGILEQQTIVTSKLSRFSRMHSVQKFGSEISFCEISEKIQSYHKFAQWPLN